MNRGREVKGFSIILTLVLLGSLWLPVLPNTVMASSPTGGDESGGGETPQPPSGLLVELLPAPLAVENLETPKFSWIVNDADRGDYQSAYQILVSKDPDNLSHGIGDVWDSGKVNSRQSSSVVYDGPSLEPATRYYWTVRTWDREDRVSPYAPFATFGTAMKDTWTAEPIWIQTEDFSDWKDYRTEVKVEIEGVAAGIWFRAQDENNGYMWQIRSDNNQLVPHVRTDGQWQIIKNVDLPFDVVDGETYDVTIVAEGSEITTYINGQKVDVTNDTTHQQGVIGFRHGSRESAFYDDVLVTAGDQVLIEEDFSEGKGKFACGDVREGKLYVGRGQSCQIHVPYDWAFFRKEFTLHDKPIAHATVYATAVSPEPAKQYVYRLYVNGVFVGLGPTRSYGGITFYNAFDVTELLNEGDRNAIGAIAYTTHDRRFLSELHVTYADGTRQVVKTDDTWQGMNGDPVYPSAGSIGTSYYTAPKENIQARYYPFGFSTPDFEASEWSGVKVREHIPNLVGLPTENLEEHDVSPVRIVDKGEGRYFLDFGHTVVGGIRLSVNGTEGDEVEIRLGEELESPETVRNQMRTGNHYRDVWKLKDGPQVLSHWGYRVFRYAEIIGAPEPLNSTNVTAVALRYPFDENAAQFESSDDVLNEVWKFSKNSIRDLNHDLYLDSPTRERNPYEADAYIQQLAHYAVDRDFALARLSHEFLYYRPTWPTEWKLSSVLAAWQDYLHTGDESSLRRNYEVLKDKALDEFMTSEGLVKKSTQNDIVDWPDSMRDGYVFSEVNTVVNAYNYRALEDLKNISQVLGHEDDARRYAELAERARRAISDKLFDPDAGHFRDGEGIDHYAVHASVFPVALGAATEEKARTSAEYIAERGMAVSVYGAPFLLESLFRNGLSNDAVRLLADDGMNSWKHMIEIGAGSTTEAWDPSQKPNMTFSHPWAASPAYIVPREMFGIVPIQSAFEKFEVTPRPGHIRSGEMAIPTIRGEIKVSFNQSENNFELSVNIPANTTAVVSVPASSKSKVTVDGVLAHEIPEVELIEESDGYAVYEVGSGKYTFVSQREIPPFPPNHLSVEPAKGVVGNTLTWEDTSNYEEGFLIERKTDSGDWEEIAAVSQNVTTYTDKDVEAEKRYDYRVVAYNRHGRNASHIVSIYTLDVHNIAYNKRVTASSEETGNWAKNTVDGNLDTRWAADGDHYPQSVTVDLEDVYLINRVGITPYQNRAYRYKVETSVNGEDYTVVVDRTSNTEGGPLLIDEFPLVAARYVRLTVTGTNSGGWASINEFRIFIPPLSTSHIKERVDAFAERGEFVNDHAVRSLTIHLTAVSRYEEKELAEKVVKHMKGFKQLLDHQKDSGLISEKAYNALLLYAHTLIAKWQ